MSDFLSRVFGINSDYNLLVYEAQQEQDYNLDLENQFLDPHGAPHTSVAVEVGATAMADSTGDYALVESFPPPQSIHMSHIKPKTKPKPRRRRKVRQTTVNISDNERALYLWANITNMDQFLCDVYWYYKDKGIINIVLLRLVDLAILVFLISLTLFLRWGIDYSVLSAGRPHTFADIVITLWKMPGWAKALWVGFIGYVVLRLIQLYMDWFKLRELRNFYRMLAITDDELLTILWPVVVDKLAALKNYNQLTLNVPLTAHDIANRIMRVENYLVALISRNVIDVAPRFMTRTLEWNIKLCINQFMFLTTTDGNKLDERVLKEYNRNLLADQLRKRFKMAALINLALCPFLVLYFVLLNFFKYFNEYKSNPGSIVGLRQYTPYAEWLLRDYNELPHFFERRLYQSMAPANRYINQFPRGFFVLNAMTLINFILGAITAVLVLLGLVYDNEEFLFWLLELSEGRLALFWILVLGTVWAVTASSLGKDDAGESPVYDPEAALQYVAQYTHYLPARWQGRLHTQEVKNEFCQLYNLKIIVIAWEILSIVVLPILLWFRLSAQLGAIVDFFRDYSVHVDHLGYICYYAMYDFDDDGKARAPATGDDKMMKLYMYFLEQYRPEAAAQQPGAHSPRGSASAAPPPSRSRAAAPQAVDLLYLLYTVHYDFDDNGAGTSSAMPSASAAAAATTAAAPHHLGVLGMINQFYKQLR